LGLGARNSEFSAASLRYDKIILMTDADVDGAHIRLLLLTFLFRYQPALLSEGLVYIACPPLYKITYKALRDHQLLGGEQSATKKRFSTSEHEVYLYDQAAFDDMMSKLHIRMAVDYCGPETRVLSHSIQRYKGLGEMMPKQLWETTMDPAQRTLKQIRIEDAMQAERMFGVCMGDAIDARKELIFTNANQLQLSDLDY
jgi:DNA gyrase subunit B